MAVSVVAGIASALSAVVTVGIKAITFGQIAGAFAIGAGLAVVSRALAPKPSLGNQMRGITTTTREPAGSRKLVYGEMRVGGQVVFITNSGSDNKFLHLVIVFASHEIESFEEFWFNDNRVYHSNAVVSDWSSYVTISKFDGTQTSADSTLVSVSTKWTNNHVLNGLAYAHFRLEWNADKFPQGVPNITAVIKGKKVYDPRINSHSATDSSTWAFSTNPALCLRDYLVEQKYGLAEDHALIDETVLTATANLCDETQEGGADIYANGQKRYRASGVIDTRNSIKDNIEQLLSAMGGRLTFSGGKYFIEGAEYKTPTITLDESDVISEIRTQTKQSRRSIYNGVKGIFVSSEKNWKVLDYPAQISSTFATQDGDPIFLDMPLPFVTNNLQAQLLAKIALLKSRQQTTISVTVNLSGLRLKVGDNVMITNTRLGYTSKVFEVLDYTLVNTAGGALGVELQLLETAAAVYDWTSSDAEDFLSGDELPLYDGRTVDNVTSLNATEIGLRGPDGALKSAVQLSWTPPTDAFVELFTVRYNKNGTTDYFETQTREANLLIEGLDKGSNYDFRVKAQNLIGVQSTGTSTNNFALTGDTTAPAQATSVNLTAGINQITAEWTNPTDIDLAFIEVFVKTTNSTPGTNDTPTAKVNGTEYIATGLSSATRHFFLRSVDFSGNKSAFVSGGSATSVLAGSGDIDGDEVLHEIPVGDLAHYWPCNSIANLGSGEEKLQEVIAGKTGVHSGTTAPTITTDSPSGKSVKISTNSGFTLLNDTDADALETSAGFAWSFWFKSESTSGSSQTRIITRDASDGWAVFINQSQSGNQDITLYGEPGTESMGSVAVNEWHHFAFSENGSGTLSGYVNGELVSTESYTPVVSARPVVIGCNTESTIQPGANPFDGKLTEIRAYSRALTKQEVRGLYKNPLGSLPAELDGDLIVDGSITATQIAANTITATQLAADSVTTTEINVSDLAGISADAGTITGGSIGGVSITSTKLHQGTGTFANSNTGFYLDNTGQFSLKDKLSFNGTLLNVDGDIKANNLNVQDATVFGTLTATDLADGIVKNASISQEVWNEIESRFGTSASSGFFEEVTGNITGGDLALATTSAKAHAAGETVYFEADINHTWSAAFEESGDDLKIDVKFQHDTDSSFSSPTTVHTQQLTVNVSQFFIGYLYQILASVQFQLTGLAAGNYFFRVSLEPVGSSPNAFSLAATPPGAGVPATFQVNEVGSGTLSSGVNADQLDGIDSTGFFRLGSSSSSINNVAYGNLTITGNLTVQGSQTSLEVATLQVQDKNVVLNYSTGDSSGSADGAGITIQDAVNSSTDATILWSTSNDRFEFSHDIKLPGSGQLLAGTNGYIDFDDDSSTFTPGTNATVVASISDVAIRTNTNDGGGGQFTVVTGNSSPSTMLSITTGGNATFAGSVTASSFTTTGDMNFGDNDKAVFGAGSDLKIFHNGSRSVISDSGQGPLRISATNLEFKNADETKLYANAIDGGAFNLYHNNSQKLATTSTGIDVTGTITTDGLTVSGDLTFANIDVTGTYSMDGTVLVDSSRNLKPASIDNGDGTSVKPSYSFESDSNTGFYRPAADTLAFLVGGSEMSRFTTSGIGINQSTVNNMLHVRTTTDGEGITIQRDSTTETTYGQLGFLVSTNDVGTPNLWIRGYRGSSFSTSFLTFGTANLERMRLDQVGNLLVGRTANLTSQIRSISSNTVVSAHGDLAAHQTSAVVLQFNPGSNMGMLRAYGATSGTGGLRFNVGGGGGSADFEAMRIDSNGNCLVGTTDTSPVSNNVAGAGLFPNGSAQFSRDSNVPVFVNRKTNDGTLIDLRRDGTTIGTIAVSSSDNLSIAGTTADHAGLLFGTHVLYPLEAGSLANGTIQLGDASYRLKNIYSDALNISSNASNGFLITATDTAPDTAFSAMKLDYNISGSGATSGDRNHIGFFIDVDSSATGGDTSDEHRIYGVFTDVRVSGDSDLVYGVHGLARVDDFGTGNQITNLRGGNLQGQSHQNAGRVVNGIGAVGNGQNLTSGSGQTDHTYGLYGLAMAQSTSSYNGAGYSAVYGLAQVTNTQTANVNNINGVRAEIQLDNKTTSAITISNAYVVRAEYDENDSDDASYTVTNGYLFYGNYSGTLPSTAYGVYIQDAVRNYFGGFLTAGVGSASAPSYAFNGDTDTGMFRPSAGALGFSTNGAEEMRLTSGGNLHVDGNITAFSTTVSDQRLKTRVEKIKNAVDKVKQIDGVSFVRTTNGEKSAGIIAQQIIDVLPEAVKKQTLPLQTGDEETEYYVVEYDAVTGLLVSAINELIKRVEDLENGDK